MPGIIRIIRKLVRSEEGLSLSEYAVMLALIVCLCLGPVQTLGCQANRAFNNASNSIGK